MRGIAICALCVFLCLTTVRPVFSGTIVRSRSEVQMNDITGPGKRNSYYEDGVRFLSELTIYSQGELINGLDYNLSTKGRYTDSKIIDRENESLEEFKFWVGSDRFETTIGDYFVNFSQYSMTRTIKGLSLVFKQNEDRKGLSLEVMGGTFDDQWEYLFYDAKGEPMDRYVGGFKLQYKKNDNNKIALNYAHVWDDENDHNRSGENAYKQHLVSINGATLLKGFYISAETAYSGYRRYIGSNRDSVEMAFASKLNVRRDIGYNTDWRGEFEYVDPDFLSLGGSYTPDRIRTSNELTLWLSRKFSMFLRQDYYRNNLEGDLTRTTRVNSGSIGIKLKRLFHRRRLRLRLSYKIRNNDVSDGGGYKTHWIRLSGSDTIKGVRIHGGFHYLFENSYTSDDLRRFSYNLSLSKRFRKGMVYMKPYIKLSYDDTDIRQEDTVLNYSAGMNFYIGRYIQGNVSVDRLETNVLAGIDSETTRYNLNISYLLKGILRRVAKGIKDPRLSMDLRVNDYNYSQGTQSYKETLFKIGLDWGI